MSKSSHEVARTQARLERYRQKMDETRPAMSKSTWTSAQLDRCEENIFASDEACYCATFGAMMARQVMDYMTAGRGAPTDDDMDLFAEEANSTSLLALEAAARCRIAQNSSRNYEEEVEVSALDEYSQRAETAEARVKELEAKVANRKWVTLPTEKSGWFWWRESDGCEPDIRYIDPDWTTEYLDDGDIGHTGEWLPVKILEPDEQGGQDE